MGRVLLNTSRTGRRPFGLLQTMLTAVTHPESGVLVYSVHRLFIAVGALRHADKSSRPAYAFGIRRQCDLGRMSRTTHWHGLQILVRGPAKKFNRTQTYIKSEYSGSGPTIATRMLRSFGEKLMSSKKNISAALVSIRRPHLFARTKDRITQ